MRVSGRGGARSRYAQTKIHGLNRHLLLAGGNWNNGTDCGSRSRNANNYRWNTNANIRAQGRTDTGVQRDARLTPGWTVLALSGVPGKIQNGGIGWLVAMANVSQSNKMKRYGNLFDKITDPTNIYQAYRNARKGKTWQRQIRMIESDIDNHLAQIRDLLLNKTFRTAPYKTKIIYEPKQREIFILPFFPDRIVHHALMRVIEPIWDKFFIYDSYACRKNKGIHAGSKRTMEFVRRNKYCLKCDISKFYPSINHDILFQIVQRKIKCKDTLWLLNDIIYSYPGETNVPIGNYTSQWLGNLYMNELDQYLKQERNIKDYIRYCDDFLLFSNDKAHLNKMAIDIKKIAFDKLRLTLSKCDLFPLSHGVDFLGYRHFRKFILLRKSTTKRVKKRLNRIPYQLKRGHITVEQYRSSLASTKGWMKWANTHNLQLSLQIRRLEEKLFETI